jgi:hypothetical protein
MPGNKKAAQMMSGKEEIYLKNNQYIGDIISGSTIYCMVIVTCLNIKNNNYSEFLVLK